MTSEQIPDSLGRVDSPTHCTHAEIEPWTPEEQHLSKQLEASTLPQTDDSGSSEEEEEDSYEPHWDTESSEASTSASSSSSRRALSTTFEDDDWSHARGDFTKHYNRLRQTREIATNPDSGSRVPLPSRNTANGATLASSTPAKTSREKQRRDRSDRATQEQVLDPRTRLNVSGLVNRGVFEALDRCISSGKEANVYFAWSTSHAGQKQARAIKIYRTSILKFRARKEYIDGENRFRGEYTSSRNSRKLIRVWAEKEFRNLRRLRQGGVPVPEAFELKGNVLVMEFLGEYDVPAPRLKDADIAPADIQALYAELLVIMRSMYISCHLVHADLSEYNVLYHRGQLVIIDVSQSVEHDHPKSLEFLKTDIHNMTQYFERLSKGACRVLPLRTAFEFIVSPNIGEAEGTETPGGLIERWLNMADSLPEATANDPALDDNLFMASRILRSHAELADSGALEPRIEDKLILSDLQVTRDISDEKLGQGTEVDALTAQGSLQTDEHSDDDDVTRSLRPRGFRHEDKDAKKERKQAVKEEQRARRETKMPKSEKKRLIKKATRG